MSGLSVRAQVVLRRTYLRPLDDAGKTFETPEMMVDRVIGHQEWLWSRAAKRSLNQSELNELNELRNLLLNNAVTLSGRTLWLGGTDISKRREASMFNCAFLKCETVNDFVDAYWLLLQGCGVGFKPVTGCLNGFANEVPTIEVRGSLITQEAWDAGIRGGTENVAHYDAATGRWLLIIGDSAEAWAKAVGKLLAMKYPVKKIVLDFSQIRPEGIRLKGYGWISSGYKPFSKALVSICNLLSKRADTLLSAVDIMDIGNHLGMTLTSRRSAEMMIYEYGGPEWKDFARAKQDYWTTGNPQRGQSNNSLVFNHRPSEAELEQVIRMMVDSGGSEPGIINGVAAQKRAPWFSGTNP